MRFVIILGLSLGATLSAAQQVPLLEKPVTLSVTSERVDVVLRIISEQGKFTFSYSPSILDIDKRVDVQSSGKPVREVLNDLFGGTVQYKEKGNHIILTKAPYRPPQASVSKHRIIKGYVADNVTMQKLAAVSIYDKASLTSAITNSFGYYEIKVDRSQLPLVVNFSKRSFQDTAVAIHSAGDAFVNVAMRREPLVIPPPQGAGLHVSASVESKEIVTPVESFPGRESQANIDNIRDTLYSNFQLSLLPFVGTHLRLSGNVVSDYSINILGGYNLGVRKLEVGGIFNVDRGNVTGVQLAGVFNVVGNTMDGLQVAGTINVNRGNVSGWQFAGAINSNISSMRGPQFAGVININGRASRGAMFAGVGNFQINDYEGSQFAGVLNVATHHVSGLQIAPVLNFARTMRGTQIGLLNISDSIRGVPVGLLSLVRKGYHKIELATDESLFTHLSFRTGVHAFYNIITVGIRPDTFGDPLWMMGWGIGTSPRLSRKLYLNFDLTGSHVSKGHLYEGESFLGKAFLGFDFQVAPKLSISLGATVNGYLTERNESAPDLSGVVPEFFHSDEIGENGYLQAWWGGRLGIRFL